MEQQVHCLEGMVSEELGAGHQLVFPSNLPPGNEATACQSPRMALEADSPIP